MRVLSSSFTSSSLSLCPSHGSLASKMASHSFVLKRGTYNGLYIIQHESGELIVVTLLRRSLISESASSSFASRQGAYFRSQNRVTLMACNGGALVLDAMNTHEEDEDIQESGCKVLMCLGVFACVHAFVRA